MPLRWQVGGFKRRLKRRHLLKRRRSKVDREPISSSTVASVGYEEDSMTLEVEFVKGTVYQYPNVPREIYEELMGASSKGNYINTVLKARFTGIRIY
jgi:hypothetical protein